MIIAGSASVVAAMMWLRNDGTMWRKMIRAGLAPATSAAVTNSSSRSARNRPRTTRASSVQPISEMMIVIAKYTRVTLHVCGIAAASPIHSGMVGIDRMTSIAR